MDAAWWIEHLVDVIGWFGFMLAGAGACVTFAWGVVQWRDQRRRELRKPFLELQLAIYREAVTAAADAVTLTGDRQRDAIELVRVLYHGRLALVEDAEVEKHMKELSGSLAFHQGAAVFLAEDAATDEDRRMGEAALLDTRNRCRHAALLVAHACRRSLAASWDTDAWIENSKEVGWDEARLGKRLSSVSAASSRGGQ